MKVYRLIRRSPIVTKIDTFSLSGSIIGREKNLLLKKDGKNFGKTAEERERLNLNCEMIDWSSSTEGKKKKVLDLIFPVMYFF